MERVCIFLAGTTGDLFNTNRRNVLLKIPNVALNQYGKCWTAMKLKLHSPKEMKRKKRYFMEELDD